MRQTDDDPAGRASVDVRSTPADLGLLQRTWAAMNRRVAPPWRRRLAVLFGGLVGTGLRVGVSALLPAAPGAWPWGTFVVNLTGAALLGYLLPRLEASTTPTVTRIPLFCIGLLGAFTTFSSFCVEILWLASQGRVALAMSYAGASLAVGFPAAHVGSRLAEMRP